jgi:hypothetical protein
LEYLYTMYKKLILTESEREEILNQHKQHGYKKPINELDDKDIDLIRGNSNQKWSRSGKQFQQDFKKDFLEPNDEYTPFWEKDKPRPSGDYSYDVDNVPITDDEYKKMFGKKGDEEIMMSKYNEELKKLGRRISSIMSHKKEFGGDEMDEILERLKTKYREIEDKMNF